MHNHEREKNEIHRFLKIETIDKKRAEAYNHGGKIHMGKAAKNMKKVTALICIFTLFIALGNGMACSKSSNSANSGQTVISSNEDDYETDDTESEDAVSKTASSGQDSQTTGTASGLETVTVGADDPVAVVYLSEDGVTSTCAVINLSGQYTVAPGIYKAITGFIDNKAIAVTMDYSEYRVIDKNGNVLKTATPEQIGTTHDFLRGMSSYYSEGLLPIYDGQYYGFINNDLEVVAPLIYDEFLAYSEGLAAVCKDLVWQFIDTQGNVVIDLGIYSGCSSFTEGLAYFFKFDGTNGYMDQNGNCVIASVESPQEGFVTYQGQFSDGLAPAEVTVNRASGGNNWVFGIIDKQGNIVFHLPADTEDGIYMQMLGWGGTFVDGMYPLMTSTTFSATSYGFIGTDGQMKIALQTVWQPIGYYKGPIYYNYGDEADANIGFYEGLCAVQPFNESNGLIGFIDSGGTVVIDYQFYHAGRFSNGLAAVCTENSAGKWIYIDASGNTVLSVFPGEDGTTLYMTYATDFE